MIIKCKQINFLYAKKIYQTDILECRKLNYEIIVILQDNLVGESYITIKPVY